MPSISDNGFSSPHSSVLAFALTGAFDNISVVVRHTLVQVLPPDSMRGRVSAVNNVFIGASNQLGELESGLAGWLLNPVWSVVTGGIGTLLVVAAVPSSSRRCDDLARSATPGRSGRRGTSPTAGSR